MCVAPHLARCTALGGRRFLALPTDALALDCINVCIVLCTALHRLAQAYGTPTLRAVIKHKWRLYASSKLFTRAVFYIIYTLVFTAFGVLFRSVRQERGQGSSFEAANGQNGTERRHLRCSLLHLALP